jgi:hypothetical protein
MRDLFVLGSSCLSALYHYFVKTVTFTVKVTVTFTVKVTVTFTVKVTVTVTVKVTVTITVKVTVTVMTLLDLRKQVGLRCLCTVFTLCTHHEKRDDYKIESAPILSKCPLTDKNKI